MRAVVYHGVGDIRLDDVPEPTIQDGNDAIVRLTASAICGTDLHFVRGTVGPMKPGTILGHEGVGIVEETGKNVRNLRKGDRVVIPSTIACGTCTYCRSGWYSKCDAANPNGPENTAFYGGPEGSGPFQGLQAEYARIPFANVGPVKLPEHVSDDDAILLSDIWTTAYFGADMAHIEPGKSVAVFGCGPVGQFAIASALKLGAGRVFAIDTIASRLEMARAQGAEPIDFNAEDPVEALKEAMKGSGVDRVIDAVGIDAERPHDDQGSELWRPGKGPGQALAWAVETVAKGGIISVIGVYPPTLQEFPFGKAFGKNITIRMGDCPHRRYLPHAVRSVASGDISPSKILTNLERMTDAIEAYKAFDLRKPGWIKVELAPQDRAQTSERGEVESGTVIGR